MCGILGSVNTEISLDSVRQLMLHRGPDAQTIWKENNTSLVHYRLSIVDIESGHQPMEYLDRYVIIFNGEVYNHEELRKKHKLACKTGSDTETILHLYHKLGPEFLQELDAMYALAIFDRKEQTIFLARDKAGKKPLHIYHNNGQFLFSSEIQSIAKIVDNLSIDETAVQKYLMYGSIIRSETPYRDVREFPAGTYGYYDLKTDRLSQSKWWNILDQYAIRSNDNFQESKEKIDFYLQRHVKRRMLSSDLEVGCFLSGGIDSGIVTALASKHTNRLKTFTVTFDGPYNEGPLAKLVADKYQTEHTEIDIHFDDLNQNIENIISGYGEPFFDSSAIPSWYVSKEARKHVTVILNGDGADELFGGYRRYIPFTKYDFFNSGSIIKNGAKLIGNLLPPAKNKKSKYNYVHRLSKLASKSNIPLYLSAGVDIFSDYEHLLDFDVQSALRDDHQFYQNIVKSNLSGLQKLLVLDFDINLFSDLLVKMDIATMAHSLEGRSPFLGTDLLDYIPTIADKHKVSNTSTKHILRDLAKDYLPSDLIHQPKRGFEIPLKDWTKTLLKDIMHDYLLEKNAYSTQFISIKNKEKLLSYSSNIGQEKNAKMLYTLFALDVWHKNK